MAQDPFDFERSRGRCLAAYALFLLAAAFLAVSSSWAAAAVLAVGATVKLFWELRVPLLSLRDQDLEYRVGFLRSTQVYALSEIRSWEIRANRLILDLSQGIPAQLHLGSLARHSREQLEKQLALMVPQVPEEQRAVS
jgi:hypothetical protein